MTRRAQWRLRRSVVLLLGVALVLGVGAPHGADAQESGLQIVSPAPGTMVAPGETISVVVSVDARKRFRLVRVVGENLGITPFQTVPPAAFSLTIPANVIGTKEIRALGITGPETGAFSDPVSIDVETSATLSTLQVNLLDVEFDELDQQFPLIVTGSFTDGTTLNITRSTRTTYQSENSQVAVVDSSGMLTALGQGRTVIRVAYGPQSLNVTVNVSSLNKQVTFALLRQELHLAHELGQIGNEKFVEELDKSLAKGQKELDEGDKKEAVEKLKQFAKKLTKAAKGETKERKREDEGEKEEDVEKEQHKLKRFVTPGAVNLLRSDAEALIADLRG